MPRQKTLRLILGDQLNMAHSWFQQADDRVTYVMMEVRQETDYVTHHIQKLAGFFAAMRAFAKALRDRDHSVIYIPLDDPENSQNFEKNILRLIKSQKFSRFEYLLPDEYRLDTQFRDMQEKLPVDAHAFDTEHFLTRRFDVKDHFSGKKRFLMESFYRKMRKDHDILIDKGKPEGGRWNYDSKNRSRYDGQVRLPDPIGFKNDVTDIVDLIDRMKVETIGTIDPARFIWPITLEQSKKLLQGFLKTGLSHFGTYQDAMTEESWALFHSRLSFSLNTKMLHPMTVIRKVVRTWKQSKERIDIAQVEGFVRQILGWREYMRGVYWALMPEFEEKNFFHHQQKLPGFYWTGQTDMNCMRAVIAQSLTQAYAHHIQRLMITGNFALLAGIDPDAVDAWYLGIYIDAIEWVEITNTRGMSQFADGGIIATKPYVSSAAYIHSMSDYCDRCAYNWKAKHGEHACPFNSLYWQFLHRHRSRLDKNPRVAMMYRTWDRMTSENRNRLLKQAEGYLKNIEKL